MLAEHDNLAVLSAERCCPSQDLMEEIASPKYEDCWYNNLTYEHSGFRFQVRARMLSSCNDVIKQRIRGINVGSSMTSADVLPRDLSASCTAAP